ncbi:MAG: hypothetical protein WBP79_06850 [Candidatus Acidiferrales bacterium]
MQDTKLKSDTFKAEQPKIPGVSNAPKPKAEAAPAAGTGPAGNSAATGEATGKIDSEGLSTRLTLSIAGAIIVIIIGVWWSHRKPAEAVAPVETTEAAAPVDAAPKPAAENLLTGPGEIATTEQLASPWSSRKFLFRNDTTGVIAPAMVVHLPSGAYWGFSLREPYGTCDMEWVTDLGRLREEYHFRAEHPMVADPCNHAVFDLARYGSGPNGLVRGEVAQGAAVRPPMAIEIKTQGKAVIAVRME